MKRKIYDSMQKWKEEDGILFLPLYMTPLI